MSTDNTPSLRSSVAKILDEQDAMVFPGVYDALSALIAQRCGFPLAFISGYGVSASYLGLPDTGFVNQSDICDTATRVCAAVDIPVIVDADTGYGNEQNVSQTVKKLIRAGAKGCFLEDQQWPKRCGHMHGKHIIDRAQFVAKLEAAIATRGDADFFIVARTDAIATDSLDEALARMHAAKQVGVDGFFIEAPCDVDQMRTICANAPKPLVANMIEGGRTPVLDKQELAAIGYQMILYPLTGVYAAAHALTTSFSSLQKLGVSHNERLISFTDFNELVSAKLPLAK